MPTCVRACVAFGGRSVGLAERELAHPVLARVELDEAAPRARCRRTTGAWPMPSSAAATPSRGIGNSTALFAPFHAVCGIAGGRCKPAMRRLARRAGGVFVVTHLSHQVFAAFSRMQAGALLRCRGRIGFRQRFSAARCGQPGGRTLIFTPPQRGAGRAVPAGSAPAAARRVSRSGRVTCG